MEYIQIKNSSKDTNKIVKSKSQTSERPNQRKAHAQNISYESIRLMTYFLMGKLIKDQLAYEKILDSLAIKKM